MRVCFIANNNIGEGITGGDRIFTEFLKRWRTTTTLTVVGSEEALNLVRTRAGEGIRLIQSDVTSTESEASLIGLFRHIVRRLGCGLRTVRLHAEEFRSYECVYSVSDFYPDFIPAWWLKRRFPSIVWVAGYYLFAPPPWAPDTPYKGRHFLRGLFYWLMQRPSYWLVNRYADVVFVTSEPDVRFFVNRRRSADKVIVVQGGVDITASEAYLTSGRVIPVAQRRYDACFVGRFHFQKGVLILPGIWKKVCEKRPNAKLAMIGIGQLETEIRRKISELGLDSNIDLLGFRDGAEKYEIFKQSKLMVHPATYDSGGMAAAEGLAWGLPGVSFDLEALKTYYPKGMVKVPCDDEQAFASAILKLLEDESFYREQSTEAHALIVDVWDWQKRADWVLQAMTPPQKARIGLDLRREDEHGGVGTVTNILKTVLMSHHHLVPYYSKWGSYFKRSCLNTIGPKLLDYGWKQMALPFSCRYHSLDAFISPAQPAPFWLPCNNIVIVHDIVQPFEKRQGLIHWLLAEKIIPISCRRATHVLTDSQAVKKEIIEAFKIPQEKITVIHLAVKNKPVKADWALKYSGNTSRRRPLELVSVFSSMAPRKNHAILYPALHALHNEMNVKWSIVGPPDMPGDYQAWRALQQVKEKANIRFYNKVSESELQDLYADSDALIMPSLYEGFGLPLIEALYSGTPHIFCSDIPVFREVSRNSPRFGFFDANDFHSLVDLIRARAYAAPPGDTSDILDYYTEDAYRQRVLQALNGICGID